LKVLEHGAQRRVFRDREREREEVTGGLRKLRKQKLHNLESEPNIIRVIKSRRLRWTRHVTCVGEVRNAYKILIGKAKGKNRFQNAVGDARILHWVLKN